MNTEVKEEVLKKVLKILIDDYSDTVFTSKLYEMFGKDVDDVKSYIKVGRKFWHFDPDKHRFRMITVTYIRSGVMFFTFDDDPDQNEEAWYLGSFNTMMLHAAQIFPYEIGKLLSKHFENMETRFLEICKQCKWDNLDGRITVEVVWDRQDETNPI